MKTSIRMKNFVCLLVLFFCLLRGGTVFAFNAYYGKGHITIIKEALKEKNFSDKAIDEIIAGNKFADSPINGEFEDSVAHFDDEMIVAGSERLINLKKEIIEKLKDEIVFGSKVRHILGRALHTLQDFYAHTNWVDGLNKEEFNDKLGRNIITESEVAKRCTKDQKGNISCEGAEQTCTDDPTDDCDCIYLGKGLQVITSGYYKWYDEYNTVGKCAHGRVPWVGIGIAKDNESGFKKGYYPKAYKQAVDATKEYIKQITGEIGRDDQNEIETLLNFEKAMVFVIDVSGSMSNQISHVKSEVSKMVNFINDTKLKTKNTVKYTLVRFSDPEVYAPQATKDITKFLKFLNEITVSSGGDCPELSMKALMKAIDSASKEATVYLITDASAKDSHLYADVIAKAGSKKIDINMLLTGSCSPIDPVYQKIATETGGQLAFINGNQEEIGSYFNIVKPNLSGDLRPVLIAEDTLNNEPRAYTILVDSTMTSMVASVSMDSKGEIKLFRPDGNEVKTGESDVLISDMLNGRVFNVTKPAVGKWRLSVSGNNGIHYSVSVMGNSEIDFDSFNFVEVKEYREGKGIFPIDGQPSIGASQTATATIFGTYATAKFELISEKGNTLKLIDLQKEIEEGEEVSEKDFLGTFDLPAERFRVVARGTDQNGAEFMRVFPTAYLGQSVKVEPVKRNNEMVGGTRFKASVRITNLGTEDNFKITAADTHGFTSSASPDTVTLKPNESEEVEVAFDVPLTPPSDTNSLSVVAKSLTNDKVQNSALFSNIAMRAGNIVTVDAGNDIMIYERSAVTLDGSRSSISGSGTLSYQWTMLGKAPDWIETPKLSGADSPNPTFTAPEVGKDGGSMVFQLTVTDSTGKQSSDVCDVRILNIDSGLDDGKEGGWCFIYAAGDAPDRKSFWLLMGVFAVAVFLARRSA